MMNYARHMRRFRHLGFEYIIRHKRGDRTLSVERVHNLMPIAAINHMFGVEFHAATQITAWFCGITEGAYTPTSSDVMATYPTLATEITAYVSATRPAWVEADPASGAIDNSASEASFIMTLAKMVRGAFLSSSSVKGGGSGVLASTTLLTTPKDTDIDDEIFITIPFELISTE